MTFLTAIAMLMLAFAVTGSAQEPVDTQVKAAIYEIDRAEKQLAGAAPGQTAKLKRISRSLENADTQLKASKNQQHDSWKSTRKRLDALDAQMQSLQNPQPTSAPATNQLSAADLNVLGSIDRQTDGFIRQLSEYKPNDYVRLKENLISRTEELKRQYRALANPSHPQAIAVAQKVLGVEQQIAATLAEQASQTSALGDVDARLEQIRQRMNPSNRSWFGSPVPNAPFTLEAISQYTKETLQWKSDAQKDLDYLQGVESKTDRSDVTSMRHRVEGELNSIDRYNSQMANRIEQELSGIDQIVTYIDKVPGGRIAPEKARLDYGLQLLTSATAYGQAMGMSLEATTEREQNYKGALIKLTRMEEANKAAATKAATTSGNSKKSTAASKSKLTSQRIEIYGSRIIEITANGEVWVDGGKAGDITADGEVWVAGDKEGDLTKDGEVWKAGNKIGDITRDGEVWRDGNQVGNVESDGTIWVNSSREGWFKGGSAAHAAVVVFYGFFGI